MLMRNTRTCNLVAVAVTVTVTVTVNLVFGCSKLHERVSASVIVSASPSQYFTCPTTNRCPGAMEQACEGLPREDSHGHGHGHGKFIEMSKE